MKKFALDVNIPLKTVLQEEFSDLADAFMADSVAGIYELIAPDTLPLSSPS